MLSWLQTLSSHLPFSINPCPHEIGASPPKLLWIDWWWVKPKLVLGNNDSHKIELDRLLMGLLGSQTLPCTTFWCFDWELPYGFQDYWSEGSQCNQIQSRSFLMCVFVVLQYASCSLCSIVAGVCIVSWSESDVCVYITFPDLSDAVVTLFPKVCAEPQPVTFSVG